MGDPQNLGLGELGQRLQALGDPVAEPRLRPYQGFPPVSAANGRPSNPSSPPLEPIQAFEEFRVTQVTTTTSASPTTPGSNPPFPARSFAPQEPPPAAAQSPNPTSEIPSSWDQFQAAPAPASAPASHTPPQAAAEDQNSSRSGFQRAINAVRSALPIVQKLLPLLDGNFATAISSLVITSQQSHHAHTPPQPPQPPIDLEPIQRGLADIHTSHRELRAQVVDQSTTLKRVEDQLEHVREATDRNTLEQQELVEDLRSMGGRVSLFAIVGLILLLVSLALNAFLLYQLQHILR